MANLSLLFVGLQLFPLFYERFDDILVILDRKERNYQITGRLVSENNEPIKDAEIIFSQNEKMKLYCKTDEFGVYRFILNENGIYDIRKGFIKQLKEQNKSFERFSIKTNL